MLTGKTIVLGVTGSIAAYKIANLASMLVKLNADVHVIMTQNATHFITPMTFETLTNNKCTVDTFDRNFNFDVKHVSLAKRGDLFLVAPCTANVIGKVASGVSVLTNLETTKAERIALPVAFKWPVCTVNLKRCILATRVPVYENGNDTGKELVLADFHLEFCRLGATYLN